MWRAVFVAEACGDRAIADEVLGLVAAHEGADAAFLGEAAPDEALALLAEAVDHHERCAALLEELRRRDPDDTSLRRDLALTRHALGDALAGRAAAAGRRELWVRAREHYQQALDTLDELAAQGALAGWDREEPEKLAAKIGRCDRELL